MRRVLPILAFLMSSASEGSAGSIDKALLSLAPEERARQACIIKGMETVRRDARLRKADRMKTSILRPAQVEGSRVTATGGAVRAHNHWYVLKFTCELTSDRMRATSFTFELGEEIPKEKWEDYGLWY